MTPLPTVSCTEPPCGACCARTGTPPGYAAFFPPDGREAPDWAWEGEDARHFESMPLGAFLELRTYYEGVRSGEFEDRTRNDDTPCLWYDPEAKRCKHYEARPGVCREFPVGGEDCLRMKKERLP